MDNATLAIGAIVKLTHSVLTEQREIVHDLSQVLAAPEFFFVAGIRTACRGFGTVTYSLFVRHNDSAILGGAHLMIFEGAVSFYFTRECGCWML